MSSPVCFEASCWRHLRLKPWPYATIIRCSYGNMQRWTFSAHTLQRQQSGLGRLVAHWCLTQLCPDGSRSANRPVIRSAQRNGSLKSNVTLYSTFALDKKKRKGKFRPAEEESNWSRSEQLHLGSSSECSALLLLDGSHAADSSSRLSGFKGCIDLSVYSAS